MLYKYSSLAFGIGTLFLKSCEFCCRPSIIPSQTPCPVAFLSQPFFGFLIQFYPSAATIILIICGSLSLVRCSPPKDPPLLYELI